MSRPSGWSRQIKFGLVEVNGKSKIGFSMKSKIQLHKISCIFFFGWWFQGFFVCFHPEKMGKIPMLTNIF